MSRFVTAGLPVNVLASSDEVFKAIVNGFSNVGYRRFHDYLIFDEMHNAEQALMFQPPKVFVVSPSPSNFFSVLELVVKARRVNPELEVVLFYEERNQNFPYDHCILNDISDITCGGLIEFIINRVAELKSEEQSIVG